MTCSSVQWVVDTAVAVSGEQESASAFSKYPECEL